MPKPCAGCIQAVERGAYNLRELAKTYPENLPALPVGVQSWDALADLLIYAAGALRRASTVHENTTIDPT